MLNEYIIVTTFCDKEEIANKIVDTLLEKRLVAGCQLSKVHSKNLNYHIVFVHNFDNCFSFLYCYNYYCYS